ncbi:MAG: sigma factor [Fusobacteriaceae bacterium]
MKILITEYEKLVLERLEDFDEFNKFLDEGNLELDEERNEGIFSDNEEVSHVEASTLEYLEEISSIERLEEKELEEKLERLNVDDKDILITKNLRIPARIAALLLKDGIDYIDLVQEGSIALIRAIDGFRKSNYINFEKYAVLFVARSIILSINRRMQETKSQFIRYFNHEKEQYAHNTELVEELDKKIAKLENLSYEELSYTLNNNEYKIVAEYYGLDADRNISIVELEKKIGLEKNQGEVIFQMAINKLSRFGGEIFQV